MQLISHPFRLAGGNVVTVPQGSDLANAEQLAVLLLTRPNDRELAPDFGIPDPTWAGVDENLISAAVDEFGPDIDIVQVDAQPGATPGEQYVTVQFD